MHVSHDPGLVYRERAARYGARRDSLARSSGRLSHLRLATFLAAVALGLVAEVRGSVVALALSLAALVGFAVLVGSYRRTRRAEAWAADVAALNEQGLHRLAHEWSALPRRKPSVPVAGHAYAEDLDLYGHASLSQILGPVATPFGAATLDGWLLEPSPPDVVHERQRAVRELAGMHELRETLSLHARSTRAIRRSDIERFLQWAETPCPASRGALRALAWLLPLVTIGLIAAQIAGVTGSSWWLLPAATSLALYFSAGAAARRTFDEAFGREPLFAYYPQMLEAAASARFDAPLLESLRARLGSGAGAAAPRLHRLQRLMHLADVRLSSMHLPLFLLTHWDLHVLAALRRWQRDSGRAVRVWLAALGELEALSALATLAHDRPTWAFPVLEATAAPVLAATGLGHPLIRDDVRVTNDVRIGPPGTFLLVTGSNMSGKSTLLRALGVNAVLAQAGAPACATTLHMPPLDVRTSIRVQDSLARGVSYFMAELERLKQVVDAAERVRGTGRTQLFLLDEILHGTNTAERRIAATRVIRHLVDAGAIGAATTHDLQLADDPALADAARLVHFSDLVRDVEGAPLLEFDYRLREGLATSTNALVLMRLVGLESGAEGGGADVSGATDGSGRGTRTTE